YRNSPTRSGKSGSLRSRPPTTDLHSSDIKQDSDSERNNASRNRVEITQDSAPFKADNRSPVDGNKSPAFDRQENITDRQSAVRLEITDSFTDQSPSTELHNADVKQDYDTGHHDNDTSSEISGRPQDPVSDWGDDPSNDMIDRSRDPVSDKADDASSDMIDRPHDPVSTWDEDPSGDLIDRAQDLVSDKVDYASSDMIDRPQDSVSDKADDASSDMGDRAHDPASDRADDAACPDKKSGLPKVEGGVAVEKGIETHLSMFNFTSILSHQSDMTPHPGHFEHLPN
ncbi:unnamed protein product, partial [Didymodactylos carnosus]